MNPFFNAMQGGDIRQQIDRLKQQYSDPQAAIQQLLNSGRVTQAQYNAAAQRARQIMAALR